MIPLSMMTKAIGTSFQGLGRHQFSLRESSPPMAKGSQTHPKGLRIQLQSRPPQSSEQRQRKYKYVSWHQAGQRSSGAWVGQVRDPKSGRQMTLGSGSDSQEAIARKVAKFLGAPISKLKLAQAKGSDASDSSVGSMYRHVYRHSTPSCNLWRVYLFGCFQGSFATEVAAAQAASRMTGLQLTDLRKVSVEAVPAKALLLKYQALRPLYDHRHPGDIESAIAEQSLSRDMFVAEPALELLSLLGKYGPWRRNLHMAWRKLQLQSQSQWGKAVDRRISRQAIAQQPQEALVGSRSRAQLLLPVLLEAIKLCHECPMAEWTSNCGAGVSHVLGFCHCCTALI